MYSTTFQARMAEGVEGVLSGRRSRLSRLQLSLRTGNVYAPLNLTTDNAAHNDALSVADLRNPRVPTAHTHGPPRRVRVLRELLFSHAERSGLQTDRTRTAVHLRVSSPFNVLLAARSFRSFRSFRSAVLLGFHSHLSVARPTRRAQAVPPGVPRRSHPAPPRTHSTLFR